MDLVEVPGTGWADAPSLDSSVVHAWMPDLGQGLGAHGNETPASRIYSWPWDLGNHWDCGLCWGVCVTFRGV